MALPGTLAILLGFEAELLLIAAGGFTVIHGEGYAYRARWEVLVTAGHYSSAGRWRGHSWARWCGGRSRRGRVTGGCCSRWRSPRRSPGWACSSPTRCACHRRDRGSSCSSRARRR
ncbi:hypothetical protein QP028_11985 [Corynebacterium suedekumii]|nr:hypothetical protein QP028_11985 [Corynebacterium suedekumii]